MLVIIRNTMVELPPLEAEMLLHRGIAHLPEVADLPMPTRYESSGTATPLFPTGYGTQTSASLTRLIKEGHEVAIHAMYGLEGVSSNWNGIKMYPRGMAPYSDDVLVAHGQDWANGNQNLPSFNNFTFLMCGC
jgi:hypothetical protein